MMYFSYTTYGSRIVRSARGHFLCNACKASTLLEQQAVGTAEAFSDGDAVVAAEGSAIRDAIFLFELSRCPQCWRRDSWRVARAMWKHFRTRLLLGLVASVGLGCWLLRNLNSMLTPAEWIAITAAALPMLYAFTTTGWRTLTALSNAALPTAIDGDEEEPQHVAGG